MRELTMQEVGAVSGGRFEDSWQYFAAMMAVGAASFGSGWGAVAVGVAVATAPVAIVGMAALSIGGGYMLMQD